MYPRDGVRENEKEMPWGNKTSGRLCGGFLEVAAGELVGVKVILRRGNIRDQVVALLALLQTTEGHLGAGDELLGVLEVLELWGRLAAVHGLPGTNPLTRVFSSQVTPACLLASV